MKQARLANRRGFILIEALLAITILAIVVISIFPLMTFLLKRTQKSKYDQAASLLLQEGLEVTYNIFLTNWTYTPGDYHPEVQGNRWVLQSGGEQNLQTRFNRVITIYNVCRDTNGNIETPPGTCTGTLDSQSKIAVTTINWNEDNIAKTLSAKLLLIQEGSLNAH